MNHVLRTLIIALALSATCLPSRLGAQVPGVKHVIVLGCDGMGSVAFRGTNAPNLAALMKRGSWTLKARGVMPTSSSPNWASMIMGAGPEQHGVTSNEWETNRMEFTASVAGPSGHFPTIFRLLREQRPAFKQAAIYDWSGFGRLIEPGIPDDSEHVKGSILTAERAIAYWKAEKPSFLFVHFDDVDHAGHGFGWESPQYFQMVDLVDGLIGGVVKAVRDSGEEDSTVVIMTADHGGVGTRHGGNTMAELLIPWIIAGPGVAQGHELASPVNTWDTAATIAHLFGVKPPEAWIGRPVREAFRSESSQ
jgi:predicted AlkP superfamily pyrophosphatase or phosphodiesterase